MIADRVLNIKSKGLSNQKQQYALKVFGTGCCFFIYSSILVCRLVILILILYANIKDDGIMINQKQEVIFP